MSESDEITELKLRLRKLEGDLARTLADLRKAQADCTLAESAAKVAKHARDELSLEVARARKHEQALSILLSPLGLLLKQLEARPHITTAWEEAHALAKAVEEAFAGGFQEEEPTDPEVEPPEIRPLEPEGAAQPYPRSPSAIMPRPPTIKPPRD